MSYPTILEVVPGSPAAGAGLAIGDELLAVNGIRPSDVIEYQQLVDEAMVDLDVRRAGLEYRVELEKSPGAPLGIRLNSSIFDRVQTCDNHCEFCFIYQLPPGMRKSLYLKDDDYRLSFLYGNFTTLTRFTELDLVRVIEERLGPLYVSIHATDPDVRSGMLRNPRGSTSLRWLRSLLAHGIEVHGQIVLCPEVNGGDVLARTCAEVIARYRELASVGIVPLGKSDHDNSTLVPHDRDSARRDLDIIHSWQQKALTHLGRRMFFASDELYLMADAEFPPSQAYESFSQHENGIGMVRAFYDELDRIEHGSAQDGDLVTGEWRSIPAAPATGYRAPRRSRENGGAVAGNGSGDPTVIVTGEYGARALQPVLGRLENLAGTRLRLLPVANTFFGGNVAVAGLITGDDVRRALAADAEPAARYLLPDVALRGDVFLDDVPLADVAGAARAPVVAAETTAAGLVAAAGGHR
jgi:putative radical SAM enzyme (TIGR03279 family)